MVTHHLKAPVETHWTNSTNKARVRFRILIFSAVFQLTILTFGAMYYLNSFIHHCSKDNYFNCNQERRS